MPREPPVKATDHRLNTVEARALWYVAPGAAELRPVTHPLPGPGEVQVRTLYSGLSRGTERLVFEGKVPKSEWERMRAPAQEGHFPFPVKYGYAAVGEVEAGPKNFSGETCSRFTRIRIVSWLRPTTWWQFQKGCRHGAPCSRPISRRP